MHPNKKLTINAIEAAQDFSLEVTCTTRHAQAKMDLIMITLQAIRANLQEAQKVLSGYGSEEDKAEAGVEADVYESLQHALAKRYLDELLVVSEKVEALFLNKDDLCEPTLGENIAEAQ